MNRPLALRAFERSSRNDLLAGPPSKLSRRAPGPLLLPRLDRAIPRYFVREGPGQARLVVDGLRMRLFADGRYTLGRSWLPTARQLDVIELPERLGRQWLFTLASETDLWIHRASEFTETLEAVGSVPGKGLSLSVGFGSTLLRSSRRDSVFALSLAPPRLSPVTELPQASEYGPLVVVDDEIGLYVDPIRGPMISRDGGERYEPVQSQEIGAELRSVLSGLSFDGATVVGATATFTTATVAAVSPSAKGAELRRWLRDFRDGWPIERAITRGVRVSPAVAAYVERGTLYWIALADGKLLGHVPGQTDPKETCVGERGATTLYFLCHGVQQSSLYRTVEHGLLRVASVPGLRTLRSATDFGVILDGACGLVPRRAARRGQYCAIPLDGPPWDLATKDEAEFALALLVAGTDAVVLSRPSLVGPARLRRLRFGVGAHRKVVSATSVNVSMPAGAQLLPNVSASDEGISGYLVLGERLYGYCLALDGTLRLGAFVEPARAAVTHGSFALVPSTSGYAYQSVDAGKTWRHVHLPVDVAASVLRGIEVQESPRCSTVGCVLGDYFYLGWRMPADTSKQGVEDRFTDLEPPSRLGVPFERRRSKGLVCNVIRADNSPQLGLTSTELSDTNGHLVREIRTERHVARFDARWSHASGAKPVTLDLRYFDGLGESSEVSSTRPTTLGAADGATDGLEPAVSTDDTSSLRLSTAFDAGGRVGVLQLSRGAESQLFGMQPAKLLLNIERHGESFTRPTDFVSLADSAYLMGTGGAPGIFELRDGGLRRVLDIDPRANLRSARLRLVRNERATDLGLWGSRATRQPEERQWYIYPIDRTTFRIEAPLRIPWQETVHACEPEEDGWLLDVEIGELARTELHPAQDDWGGRGRALVLATELGVCVKRILLLGPKLSTGKAPRGARLSSTARIRGRYVDPNTRSSILECGAGS